MRRSGLVSFGAALGVVALVAATGIARADGRADRKPETDVELAPYTANNFGGVGLIDNRTARMNPQGTFEVGGLANGRLYRLYVNATIFPWLEGTFRYTDYREEFRSDTQYLDRGFDLKLRLQQETPYLPEIAIGLQDLGGTGIYAGEYVVLNKRWGDLDFSLGVGWGYLGNRDRFGPLWGPSERSAGPSELFEVGRFEAQNWFRGPVSLFGGVEWFTPVKGLSLKLEYSGADPSQQAFLNRIERRTPINVGLSYKPTDWLNFSLNLENGTDVFARMALSLNLLEARRTLLLDDPKPALVRRPSDVSGGPVGRTVDDILNPRLAAASTVSDPLLAALKREHLPLERIEITGGEVRVYVATILTGDQASLVAARVASRLPAGSPPVSIISASPGYTPDFVPPVPAPAPRVSPLGEALVAALKTERLSVQSVEIDGRFVTIAVEDLPPAAVEPTAERLRAALAAQVDGLVLSNGRQRIVAGQRPPNEPFVPEQSPAQILFADRFPTDPVAQGREAEAVFAAMEADGMSASAYRRDGGRATVWMAGSRYRLQTKTVGRVVRALSGVVPRQVEQITVVLTQRNMPTAQISVLRSDFEDAESARGSAEEIWVHAQVQTPDQDARDRTGATENAGLYPRFAWSLRPDLRPLIGSREGLVLTDLVAEASASVELLPGLVARGTVNKYLVGNLDEAQIDTASGLPRVRTDLGRYLREGRDNIENLQVDYLFSPAQDVFARLSAGYFEPMFAGVGGEVLYRPFNERYAIGMNLYFAKQREFDQLFGLRNYETVTGHVGGYYQSDFYGLRFEVQAGRYLAGDWGATFDISRVFQSGVRLGAFATVTTASARDFGEGSFDKGFYVSVPLEWFLQSSTAQTSTYLFRPVTRDGGAMLGVGPRLYDLTGEDRPTTFDRDYGRILD
ncbi:YjbH domain-containing protein [Zavarzinia sp. CC-PAN008]|uniref:YjbH domain-containing protein n=1 Tax=Zavarzinia sp. CC-PAN008 TaxID=3243332 RepID=UPI003F746B04